jgi:hypothetical protein
VRHLRDLYSFEGVLVVALFCKIDASESPLSDFLNKTITSNNLKFEVFVSQHFGQFLVLVFNVQHLTVVEIIKSFKALFVVFIRFDEMANIYEPTEKLRRKYFLIYFSIFLK